jgi:hypothetical protein
MGSSQDRPDKSYILAHYSPEMEIQGSKQGEGIVLTELRPGVFEKNPACVHRFSKSAGRRKYNIAYRRMSK